MTPQILAALLAALALGVALLLLGLRGRRMDRTPLCRDCGFDLSGVLPDGKTCPECGSGLNRAKAVRIGRRKRMIPVAATGALLVLLPTGALLLSIYTALTGASLASYKPIALLLTQIRHGNADSVREAGAELLARLQAGELSDPQLADAVAAILDVQPDAARPWDESLGDVIEIAHANNRLADGIYQQFLNHAIILEPVLRPRVAQGDPFPIGIRELTHRAGGISAINVSLSLVSAEAAGVPLEVPPGPIADRLNRAGSRAQNFAVVGIWGSASGVEPHPPRTHTVVRQPTATLPVGEQGCELVLLVEAQPAAIGRGSVWKANSDAAQTARFASRVHIVPPEERLLAVTAPGDDVRLEIVRNVPVRAMPEFDRRQDGPPGTILSFSINRIPVGLAHKVFVRDSHGEHELMGDLTITGGAAAAASPYRSRGLTLFRDLSGEETIDVILRPQPDLALRTIDVSEVYGGELEFRAVRVEKR